MRLSAALSVCLLIGTSAHAAELGRFFFTPAERAALNLARTQKPKPPEPPPASKPADATPAPEVLTYNGVVRRSDGRAVLWINDRAIDAPEALSGVASTRVRNDGAMIVKVQPAGPAVDLKVGQSIDLSSGSVREAARRAPVKTPERAKAADDKSATAGPAAKPATDPQPEAIGAAR